MDKVREYFNQNADGYVHDLDETINELFNGLDLKDVHRVLDLGAGKGILEPKLSSLVNEVTALDISEGMLSYAPKFANVKYVNADFYTYHDKPFDLIICFDAYPHFLDKENFINKCAELLKRGGLLVVFHDSGRQELNTHHKQHALKVSRILNSVNEEVQDFLKQFEAISLMENDMIYKIVLRKK